MFLDIHMDVFLVSLMFTQVIGAVNSLNSTVDL